MKAIGILMAEHRLIERMMELLRRETLRLEGAKRVDAGFIDTAADFIRIYADKTHHRKEEDILFRDLAKKALSPKDREAMRGLIDDHQFGRRTVGEMLEAKAGVLRGDLAQLEPLLQKCGVLPPFYAEHIRKEDQIFFPAAAGYFSEPEEKNMIQEFFESDRKMIHEKYRAVVENLEIVPRP